MIQAFITTQQQTLLDEVLLYLFDKTSGKLDIGMNTVQRLLAMIDKEWFEAHGECLFRPNRRRACFGPMGRVFTETVGRLLADGSARLDTRRVPFSPVQKKLLPNRPPDLTLIPPDVLAVVDGVLKRVAAMHGTYIGRDSCPPDQFFGRYPDRPQYIGTAIRRAGRRHRYFPASGGQRFETTDNPPGFIPGEDSDDPEVLPFYG